MLIFVDVCVALSPFPRLPVSGGEGGEGVKKGGHGVNRRNVDGATNRQTITARGRVPFLTFTCNKQSTKVHFVFSL